MLCIHHIRHLQKHPHVRLIDSLLQDQILGDAEATLQRYGGEQELNKFCRSARKLNLGASRGPINADWIEPETLFWASWKSLPAGEKSAIAREVIGNFLTFVHEAAAMDLQSDAHDSDPMESAPPPWK